MGNALDSRLTGLGLCYGWSHCVVYKRDLTVVYTVHTSKLLGKLDSIKMLGYLHWTQYSMCIPSKRSCNTPNHLVPQKMLIISSSCYNVSQKFLGQLLKTFPKQRKLKISSIQNLVLRTTFAIIIQCQCAY